MLEYISCVTLNDFDPLDMDSQADAVWSGTFLGQRTLDNYVINLYAVSSFYVEIFYCAMENAINFFKPFSTLSMLALYLN